MSRRLCASALAVAALIALTAAPAGATTRTPLSPAVIRHLHDSGVYGHRLAVGWDRAEQALTVQLAKHPSKPAVVLDIDETSLSNYGCLNEVDFALTGLVTCVVQSRSTAIPGARTFVRRAQRRGVRVFFVTGAPAARHVAARGQPPRGRLRRVVHHHGSARPATRTPRSSPTSRASGPSSRAPGTASSSTSATSSATSPAGSRAGRSS